MNLLSNLWESIVGEDGIINQIVFIWQLTPKISEDLQEAIVNNSIITIDYIVLVILSALISSLGIVIDSGVVIIGAMLIAPLIYPIRGFAFGICRYERNLIISSFTNILISIFVVVLFSFLIGYFSGIPEYKNEFQIRTEPTLVDFLIGLFSGFLSGYVNVRTFCEYLSFEIIPSRMFKKDYLLKSKKKNIFRLLSSSRKEDDSDKLSQDIISESSTVDSINQNEENERRLFTPPYLFEAISGTAIAVSLVPPLCVAGLSLSRLLNWKEFSTGYAIEKQIEFSRFFVGAFLTFFSSFFGIILGCLVVYILFVRAPRNKDIEFSQERARINRLFTFFALTVITVLSFNFFVFVGDLKLNYEVKRSLINTTTFKQGSIINSIEVERKNNSFLSLFNPNLDKDLKIKVHVDLPLEKNNFNGAMMPYGQTNLITSNAIRKVEQNVKNDLESTLKKSWNVNIAVRMTQYRYLDRFGDYEIDEFCETKVCSKYSF